VAGDGAETLPKKRAPAKSKKAQGEDDDWLVEDDADDVEQAGPASRKATPARARKTPAKLADAAVHDEHDDNTDTPVLVAAANAMQGGFGVAFAVPTRHAGDDEDYDAF
jgi:hypothetical protein